MVAVTVQSIADDIARWIATNPGGRCAQRVPSAGKLRRPSKGAADIFVSYAVPASTDFARAVAARLRLERPHLRVVMDSIEQRSAAAASLSRHGAASPTTTGALSDTAKVVLVALTREALACPLVAKEVATCLACTSQAEAQTRLAFVYHVRNTRGQDPLEMLRHHGPACFPSASSADRGGGVEQGEIPIFEYLHEYEDLCVSAILHWLGCANVPSGMTLARLHSSLLAARESLHNPLQRKQQPALTQPGNTSAGPTSLSPTVSAVAVQPKLARSFAIGLLHDSSFRSTAIADDVAACCSHAFGTGVRVASVLEEQVPFGDVANLIVIVTQGTFHNDAVVRLLVRGVREGGISLVLLQDMRSLPNIWDEFEVLPSALRPAVASIIAVPYLKSYGFSACLARITGTNMLSPLIPSSPGKPAAARYGRPSASKLIDLFLCHFQKTGLDWAFVMRLNFVQHAGPSFKVFLDLQSLQNAKESSGYVEQSHALALLVTPGIFTRFFCQKELLATCKAGVQVIFIQHMRSCIDLEEELDCVRGDPAEFMSRHGEEYSRAGGKEADLLKFQQVLFERLWTPRYRPPVFAYLQELEGQCVREIIKHLKNRRAQKRGDGQLRDAANAVLSFLRMIPEDKEDVRTGLSVVANQASGGSGNDICAAFVQSRAMPVLSEVLTNHALADSAVAVQAFRALRCLGATSCGEAALLQFAETEGAVQALHQVLREQTRRPSCQEACRREALKLLRGLCSAGPAVEKAIRRHGLWSEFGELFSQLRAELEPLDEIREMLNLAPVELPRLEFALHSWHQTRAGGELPLPAEVKQASDLLKRVEALREAVDEQDGQRIHELLSAHLDGMERCSGVESLLLKAKALSAQFLEQQELHQQQARTAEEQAQARNGMQEQVEQLLIDVAERPAQSQMQALEDAIVACMQMGCPEGFAERAREALEELRCTFDRPFEFLATCDKPWRYIKPAAAVQALLSVSTQDRKLVLKCFATSAALAADTAQKPHVPRRADVEGTLRAMGEHEADPEVQAAACRCLSGLLMSTCQRHGLVSARALVEAVNGDILAVKAVVSAIALALEVKSHFAVLSEAACHCLAQLAGLGDAVVAEVLRCEGTAQVWLALKQLGPSGRERHSTLVARIIQVLEEVCRHGSKDRALSFVDTLMKVCDIYDDEGEVCVSALRALRSLFEEQPGLAVGLLLRDRRRAGEDEEAPSSPQTARSSGMQVLLRNLRMHERHSELQELGCSIIEQASGDSDGGAPAGLDTPLCCSFVAAALAVLRGHSRCVPAVTAACACLGRLVELLPDATCGEVMRQGEALLVAKIMDVHRVVKRVQTSGLALLGALAQRFPVQTLGEVSIRAIVAAMRCHADNLPLQQFGCAALRRAAELGGEVAGQVAQTASQALLQALTAFPGRVSLHKEALTTLSLIAAVSPGEALNLGEAYAVPSILDALASLQPEVAEGQPGAGPSGSDAVLACLAACRAVRTICSARAQEGASFDEPFHASVCQATQVLADLLACSADYHDLQLEVLQLLREAVEPDKDGTLKVGSLLARPCVGGGGANMAVWVLLRFHTSDDCIAIFGLIALLANSDSFAASMSAGLAEVLRWTAIFRDDVELQQEALNVLTALLQSPSFDSQQLLSIDGMEALLLTAARHSSNTEVVSKAEEALLAIATRHNAQPFYAVLQAMLLRHESHAAVVVAVGHSLCTVFEAGVGVADALFSSGAMQTFVQACRKHQHERGVATVLMLLVDLSLQTPKNRDQLLQGGTAELLVDMVQHCLAGSPEKRKPAGMEEWLWEATLAARLAKGRPQTSADVTAGLRALHKLLCANHFASVVTPELVAMLSGTMANSADPTLLEPAAALLGDMLRLVEEHLTWTVCQALAVKQEVASEFRASAALARFALDAEVRGLRQWRSGNFLPAAAEFRRAAEYLASVQRHKQPPTAIQQALLKHKRELPLEEFAQLCEEHQRLIHQETATARTTADVTPKQQVDDCPICLEPLHGQTEEEDSEARQRLWQCDTCHNHIHKDCIEEWQKTKASCPFCRCAVDLNGSAAFHRARAIAQAASDAHSRGPSQPAGQLGQAFLGASVAALWRAALRLGHALQLNTSVLSEVEARAAELETRSAPSCEWALGAAARMEVDVVQGLEVLAGISASPTPGSEMAVRVVEALAADVLQRRCAALAEEAAMWLADASRMRQQGRLTHAEQLLLRVHNHLCEVAQLAPAAHLPPAGALRKAESVAALRHEILAMRERGQPDESTGHVNALRPLWPGLTPFHACMERAWARPKLAEHLLGGLGAVAAVGHAAHVGVHQRHWAGLFRRAGQACGHLLEALFHDRVPSRVVGLLSGAKGRATAFKAVRFLQQLFRCGDEHREACFSHVDGIAAALAADTARRDPELRACLSGLVHELVFEGNSEERMVRRLQREAAPRSAATLQEWFLDTLLAQHGVSDVCEEVLQGNGRRADAWTSSFEGTNDRLLGSD